MNGAMGQIEARPANWLPIPGEESKPVRRHTPVDEHDLFPKASVESFYPKQGAGVIVNDRGQRIPFTIAEVTLIGDRQDLEAGIRVGYDASCTSRGLRITRLKVY